MLYIGLKSLKLGLDNLWNNDNKWYNIIIGYIIVLIGIAIIFAFVYAFFYGLGTGYLKYGNCSMNYDLKNDSINQNVVVNGWDIIFYGLSNSINTNFKNICPMGWNQYVTLVNSLFSSILIVIIISIAIARSNWNKK
jgi:hypothetical protein